MLIMMETTVNAQQLVILIEDTIGSRLGVLLIKTLNSNQLFSR